MDIFCWELTKKKRNLDIGSFFLFGVAIFLHRISLWSTDAHQQSVLHDQVRVVMRRALVHIGWQFNHNQLMGFTCT